MSTFFDPITGKMVTIKPQKLIKHDKPKAKIKKLTLDLDEDTDEGEILQGAEVITSRFDKKAENVNNTKILDKKFVSKGKYIDYIIHYLKNKNLEKACETYSHSQDDIGFLLINRFSGSKPYLKILANMFYRSRDWNKAASVCEQIDAYEKAAMLYERGDDYYMAAETYLKVKNNQKAAEMFEKLQNYSKAVVIYKKIGNLLKAAEMLEKLDKLFEAGEIYFRLNSYKKAMDLLQKVDILNENYKKAQVLINKIIEENNKEIDVEIDVDVDKTENSNSYVSVMEGFNYLSSLPLFGELSLKELKDLYNITETIKFEQGDRIITQDTEGEGLFIIRNGQIDIIDEKGDVPKHIVTLPSGVHVGEMSLVDDSKTSATVISRGDVLAFKISKEEFNKLLEKDDKIARKIYLVFIQTLSKRLRETNEKVKK